MTESQINQRREAGRKVGRIRAAQFTSESQKHARAHVSREACQRNGRKGYAALAAKDPTAASRVLAEWRKTHPSTPEQMIDRYLDRKGIIAEREVSVFGLYLDRVVGTTAIEIDGNGLHGDHAPDAEARAKNDARKEALCYALGLILIRLPEASIRDGSFVDRLPPMT